MIDKSTLPQADGEGFGTGNLGRAGIREWFRSHHCTALCTSLHLTHPFPDDVSAVQRQWRSPCSWAVLRLWWDWAWETEVELGKVQHLVSPKTAKAHLE